MASSNSVEQGRSLRHAHSFALLSLVLAVVFLLHIQVHAQNPETNANGTSNSNVASPSPTQTPIPVSSIVSEAEKAETRMLEIRTFLDTRPDNFRITSGLADISRDIQAHSDEVEAVLAGRASLEELNEVENRAKSIERTLSGWTSTLQSQAAELEERIKQTRELRDFWQRSVESYVTSEGASNANELIPEQASRRANDIAFALGELIKEIERKRADVIGLQAKVSEADTKAQAVLLRIRERRAAMLENLFAVSDDPIWRDEGWSSSAATTFARVQSSLNTKWLDLRNYAGRNPARFAIHAILIVLLALGLGWAAKTINPMVEAEPKLERTATVFDRPLATALMLSILISGVIYPNAPPMLSLILGFAAVFPAVYLLKKLMHRPLTYILYALAVLFVLDRIREFLSIDEFASRLTFLIEIFLATAFFFWFRRSRKVVGQVAAEEHSLFTRVRQIATVAAVLFAIAFGASLVGLTSLSQIIGTGVLRSAYSALFLYALYEVFRGLVTFALRVRPLALLSMVRSNRIVIRNRMMQIVRIALVLLWAFIALRALSLIDLVRGWLSEALSASFTIGSLTFSVGHIVGFVLAVWVAFMLSRFLRFVLEEDVFPRIGIAGGVSYAVSTMVHYAILMVGFVLAIIALGFELSQFAVIAGAVGIGVGFGLQNVINNFVSGLILLFERPVKVGDTVQISTHIGSLTHIGLRASVLRKVDGSDVILPNSQLISEEVINWTMSDEKRRLDVPVGVAYGTDPKTVLDLLAKVGLDNRDIMDDPKPRALFMGFGESSLDFELRAWTDNSDDWVQIRSDLVTSINEILTAENIEIPFPQRDVNIKNLDKDVLKS